MSENVETTGQEGSPRNSQGQFASPSQPTQHQPQQTQQPQGSNEQAEFLQALNAKFGDIESKLSKSEQNEEILKKLQSAFSEKKEEKQNQKWIDSHLKTLLQARQAGQEMPITEDLVVQMQKQMDTIEQLQQQLKQAESQVNRFNDPGTWQDNQVYSDMDNTLSSTIEKIYGKPSPEIHRTVSNVIADRLKQVRAEAPDIWEKIRNDKAAQKKIVHKAVSEIVPPQAMNMMRKEYEDSQPITQSDFEQAWKEASTIEDPKMRSQAKALVRQKLFEHTNPFRMKSH